MILLYYYYTLSPLSALATVEWTKVIHVFIKYVALMDNLIILDRLLSVWEHDTRLAANGGDGAEGPAK